VIEERAPALRPVVALLSCGHEVSQLSQPPTTAATWSTPCLGCQGQRRVVREIRFLDLAGVCLDAVAESWRHAEARLSE
jgi:hypothetical protein